MSETNPEPSYDDILDSAASEYADGAIKEQLAGTLAPSPDQPPPEVKTEPLLRPPPQSLLRPLS